MAPIKLYIDYLSQPSRAVHMLLLEGKVPFEVQLVPIQKGATRSPEFLRINPNGHVPAIDDNGFILYESHAIMRYLVNKYHMDDAWYPADPTDRARIDQLLDWHHKYLRSGSSQLMFSTQFAKALGVMTDEQIVRVAKEGTSILKKSLRRIEESYLPDDTAFLMGQKRPSIVDLSFANELYMTVELAGFDISAWPKTKAWLKRVEQATPNSWPIANATLTKVLKARAARKAKAVAAGGASANPTSATAHPVAGAGTEWSAEARKLQAATIFSAIREQLSSPAGTEAIKKLQSTFKFVVSGPSGASNSWLLDMKTGKGSVRELPAGASDKADVTFTLSDDNFVALATTKLKPEVAFLGGKLKLQGNMPKAMAFNAAVFQNSDIKARIQEAVKTLPIQAKL